MADTLEVTNPVLSQVIAKHSEEPCTTLFSHTLDMKNFSKASEYIPTSRIKKWKPTNTGLIRNENEYEYCYLDFDAPNNKSDPLLPQGQSCSASFFNSPLITNAFEDTNRTKDQRYPYNKCVIEIQKDKVSDQSLNDLWDGIGKLECSNLNMKISAENKTLEDAIRAIRLQLDSLYKEIMANDATIHNNEETIKQLIKTEMEWNSKVENIVLMVNDARKEAGNLTNNLDHLKKYCDVEVPRLEAELGECKRRLQLITDDIMVKRKSLQDIQVRQVRTQSKLDALKAAYEVLKDQVDKLTAFNTDFKDKVLPPKNTALEECTSANALAKRRLKECSERLTNMNKRIDDLTKRLEICRADLAKQLAAKNQLQKELDFFLNRLRALTALLNDELRILRECQADTEAKKVKKDELQAIYDKLRLERQTCQPIIDKIAAVRAEIDEILSWCKLATDSVVASAQVGMQAASLLAEQAKDACVPPSFKPPAIPPEPMSIQEYRMDTKFKMMRASQHSNYRFIKAIMIGGWNITNSKFETPKRIDANGLINLLPVDVPSAWKSSWQAIMPFFRDDKGIKVGEEITIFIVGPKFQVSQAATVDFAGNIDNEITVWINDEYIFYMAGPAEMKFSASFKPNVTYQIAIAYMNGTKEGYMAWWENKAGEALQDILLYPPLEDE